jgi:hypothetical protein
MDLLRFQCPSPGTVSNPQLGTDTKDSVGGLTVDVGLVKLKVGDAISATFTLAVALVVTAAVLPYIHAYSPLQGGKRA